MSDVLDNMTTIISKEDADALVNILNNFIFDSSGLWAPDSLQNLQRLVKVLGGQPYPASLHHSYNKKNSDRKKNRRK